MESCGQSFFSLLVKSNVMREMSEISRSSTSLLAESNGFTDKNVTLMGLLPSKRIYEAVRKIPRGKVATYGQVAELAGDKKMARAVGNALHKNPDPDTIPCYRVVNAKGELAGKFAFGGADVQAKLVEADGIEVIDDKVDLKKYGIF